MEDIIVCEGLNKYYSGVHALKDLSLKIKKDSVVGLIGDNGAGKSTLIKILSGAHQPDSGHIYFEGNKVKFKSTKEAMNLGIETIYQYSALIPEMSIARNIFIGREQTQYNVGNFGLMKTKTMQDDAMKALTDVELHLRSPDTPVNQLSGGERQGVAIARAIYNKAELIVLDEPTNNLSLNETQKVFDFVLNVKKSNRSVLFIGHNIFHVYDISDRFVLLDRGRIVHQLEKTDVDSPENLIRIMKETVEKGE